MENKSHAIIAITFLVVFLGGAAIAWYWLSYQQPEPRWYKIITTQSVSVANRSPVIFKGIQIGRVRDVHFDPHDGSKVDILFTIHKDALVTESTYAVIQMQGLTGGDALVLKLGSGTRAPLPTSRRNPALIPLQKSLLGKLQDDGAKDLKNISHIIVNLKKMLSGDNRQHIKNTLRQIDQATRKIVKLENNLLPLAKKLPSLADTLEQTLRQSHALLKQATQLVGDAQQPLHSLQRRTLPDINQLSESLLQTSKSIEALSNQLQANPQSLIFGAGEPQAGPGEPGFRPSRNGDTQ